MGSFSPYKGRGNYIQLVWSLFHRFVKACKWCKNQEFLSFTSVFIHYGQLMGKITVYSASCFEGCINLILRKIETIWGISTGNLT